METNNNNLEVAAEKEISEAAVEDQAAAENEISEAAVEDQAAASAEENGTAEAPADNQPTELAAAEAKVGFAEKMKNFWQLLMSPSQKVLNLPNLLSLLRVALVPVFFATLIFMRDMAKFHLASVYVPAIIYILTAVTDALDGKIARRYGLVTDFGKFIDPLADKFLVIGSLIALLAKHALLVSTTLYTNYTADLTFAICLAWLVLIVLFRELAVTSLRLVVAGKKVKVDLAANIMGKLKTVSQMVGTVVFILEPSFKSFAKNHVLSYIFMVIIAFTTIYSGINYFLGYLPFLKEKKTEKSAQ